jgi:polyhydroxybutyrate depolymerase
MRTPFPVAVAALLSLAAASGIGCGSAPPPKDAGPKPTDPRPMVVEAPGDLRADAPVPLVVALHGFGGDPKEVTSYLQLVNAARRHRFVLVAPSGNLGSDGKRYWNASDACCDFADRKPDDVAYLDKLIEEQKARYPIDPKRVFVVGFSNGAFMAHRFACERAATVAAIVSMGGAGDTDRARCRPKEAVSLLEIHGDEDAIVNYRGGFLGGGLPQRSPYLGARETLDIWLRRDVCKPVPDTSTPPFDLDSASPDTDTSVQAWRDCERGGVELWTMRAAGHHPTLTSNFGERVWAFLADHAKR